MSEDAPIRNDFHEYRGKCADVPMCKFANMKMRDVKILE